VGILYIGLIILRKVYELELIREEFYFYLLVSIGCGFVLRKLNKNKKNKKDIIVMLILLVIMYILLNMGLNTNIKYISLESPLGKHKIIAENTVEGFETGTTKFYIIKMSVFNKCINAIRLEKTGGIIQGSNSTTLKWINEDILEIKYRYTYNNELCIYKVNFDTNRISKEIVPY
jgi:hypothetical protein